MPKGRQRLLRRPLLRCRILIGSRHVCLCRLQWRTLPRINVCCAQQLAEVGCGKWPAKRVSLHSGKGRPPWFKCAAVSNHPARHLSNRRQRERRNLGSRCHRSHRKCRRSVRPPVVPTSVSGAMTATSISAPGVVRRCDHRGSDGDDCSIKHEFLLLVQVDNPRHGVHPV